MPPDTARIVAIWVHILGIAIFVGPQFFLAFAWAPAACKRALSREANRWIAWCDWRLVAQIGYALDFADELYLHEVAGELIEAVGVVTEQIAFDEHVGDGARTISRHSCMLEKCGREKGKLVGAVSIRQGF